ncbi:MAG: glycoside hydrolase family 18 protein [Candidatus Limnocylindrales bacterium]
MLLLLVPFVISACITIDSDLAATPTPAPAATDGSAGALAPTPTATATPLPTPEPTPEPVEAEVLGFVPYWLLEDAARTIDPSLLTIAAFHSVEASQDGRLVSKKPNGNVPGGWAALGTEAFTSLKEDLQAAGVKVVPVVQRTAWTEGTRERAIRLLSRKKSRTALVERIVQFVGARGFDGVNLDFEPIPARVSEQYVTFVRELRAALDAVDPELHLSIDVVPGLENYDLAALTADDAADLAVIMGYGYSTPNSGVARSTAPLAGGAGGSDLTGSVTAALEQTGGDGTGLMLALPWYGHSWPTRSASVGSRVRAGDDLGDAATVIYAEAVRSAARGGRNYDEQQASAWTAYADKDCSSCTATWRQVWYDDPDSFSAKIGFALDAGLAGVGMWAPGMDGAREEMWWALRNQLRPIIDESPPNGSPALDPETVRGDIDGRGVVQGSASLRLFAADEVDGSGLALVRIGLEGALEEDGRLAVGRTYPAVERIEFPLADPETGGSPEEGPRSIHVQWRDLAGNWSTPVVLEAHVLDPATTAAPADL